MTLEPLSSDLTTAACPLVASPSDLAVHTFVGVFVHLTCHHLLVQKSVFDAASVEKEHRAACEETDTGQGSAPGYTLHASGACTDVAAQLAWEISLRTAPAIASWKLLTATGSESSHP